VKLAALGLGAATLLAVLGASSDTRPAPKSISVVLVLDTTLSITTGRGAFVVRDLRTPWQGALEKMLENLASHLTPADEVRVASVGGNPRISPPLTHNPQDLISGFRSLQSPGAPSRLWDALFDSVAILLVSDPMPMSRTHGIVLVTDGFASGNVRSRTEGLALARTKGVSISVVQILKDSGASAQKLNDIVSPEMREVTLEHNGTHAACVFTLADADKCLSDAVTGAIRAWR
jgi:hypothetical protein